MSKGRIVWSDDNGDLRKKDDTSKEEVLVNEKEVFLHLRRLTAGKGRTVIEISNLPDNKIWCQNLAKECKKRLGVGGSYKQRVIEIHGEKVDKLTALLDNKSLKYKKIGG